MKLNYNVVWAFLVTMTLCLLVPLLITTKSVGLNSFLIMAILIYSGTRISLLIIRNERRLLELTFWIFVYIWIGISALIQVERGMFPWPGSYSDFTIRKSLIVVLVGLISYDIGMKLSKKDGSSFVEKREVDISRQKYLLIFCISLAVSFFSLYQLGGSVKSLWSVGIPLSAGSKMSNLIFTNLFHVPLFVCALVGIHQIRFRRIKKDYKLLVALSIIISLIVNNPFITSRYWVGSVYLAFVFTLIPWKKRTTLVLCVSLIMAFAFIFPSMDLNRELGGTKVTADYFATSGDFDAFQQILNTVEYVEIKGIVYGNQLLGALLFWFPREYWSDKPDGTGQFVGEFFNYFFTNLSCPLWAELYINFSWIGVIVGLMLYGYITGKMQIQYIISTATRYPTLSQITTPFLAAYQIFLLRGDLLNGIAYMSCFFLFVWILNFQTKRKREEYSSNTTEIEIYLRA